MSGTLYLCATPIGNLNDITLRTLETLKAVDLIAAEDTRHSRILLDHFGITTPMTSYHEHNKYEKAGILVEKLLTGMNLALITDAGTPAISDPGEELVRQCLAAGISVTSLPGPCACITALTISGLPARRFCFEAFLPSEKKERRQVLEELKEETRTTILYEAPHRLGKTLAELCEALGERRLTICRELTKKYEEGWQTTLSEAASFYQENEARGEFVLVLEGRSAQALAEEKAREWEQMSLPEHLEFYLNQGMEKKEAMKQMAKDRGCTKREIYQGLL
ncbi:16S rRNA (cytidine(1402)-2'-O)-methyltransferase [Cuneatibacter sp. NSJ-177]|uniref:16S rRNA (cytidine(1402)-2'-O)-methyltransferase n=1 Tax=Cuneatibacter sp. NSJ-177 TaxID=2931401 RepID=UPI001FD3B281|nr:16S rRNA (cytidine(1402)-2'-O)-methyltransferase [Cuneatibacter sp. NSJ-177]MCJ7836750.1 16S rRNA (cytidine(1402)-2'-O)-methyltransferase [Cuneatibacter sp. NSJ-177]